MLYNVLLDQQGGISLSPAPEVDKLLAGPAKLLSPGLPLESLKRYLGALLALPTRKAGLDCPSSTKLEKEIIGRVRKGLEKDGSPLEEKLEWQESRSLSDHGEMRRALLDEELFMKFIRIVEGRQVAEGEFPFLAQWIGLNSDELITLMQKAVLKNKGEWLTALSQERSAWRCSRCGSTHSEVWPSLYGPTSTCLGCKSIGALSSLQVLFRMKPDAWKASFQSQMGSESNQACQREFLPDNGEGACSFEFSAAQRKAAVRLLSDSEGGIVKETLVWAACGAGKTEVCFPLINDYLREGKNVLFAAPRQDVVHDVHPRLRRFFPRYQVRLFSGAAPPRWDNSQLTVATTHQVLRFYRAFHLLIFDEMDAYPFVGNKILEYGMRQALREDGRLIYLTATPSPEILNKVSQQTCSLIRLPARYHGYPVPLPEVVKIKLPEGETAQAGRILQAACLPELRAVLEELLQNGPLLVFVPTIALVRQWVLVLRTMFQDRLVEGSWSSEPERRRKVLSFIGGKCDIFVCTSILERGITVNGVQVVILYAQHALYDVRTLVQMAGRIGRTARCPGGRAVFLASKETKAMITAQNWIREQNALAQKEGFLNV